MKFFIRKLFAYFLQKIISSLKLQVVSHSKFKTLMYVWSYCKLQHGTERSPQEAACMPIIKTTKINSKKSKKAKLFITIASWVGC